MKLVAIIDDEVEMHQIYSMVFEEDIEQGLLELKFFSDAREFAAWIHHNCPDLIMMDINMPYLSGIELVKLIKSLGHSVPTYFVSGHEERDYRKISLELGINRFLMKPLELEQVLGLIETDLGIDHGNF